MKTGVVLVVIAALASSAFAFGPRCSSIGKRALPQTITGAIAPPANLKVAFVGDQGLNPGSRDVLNIIKNENVNLVIHSGDFDYESDPEAWIAQIDSILGNSLPYFASIGNHDNLAWRSYQQLLLQRFARSNASCTGDFGVQATCNYQGLLIVLSGVGTRSGDIDHDAYITQQLSAQENIWKIVSWHKNHRQYQIGGKVTEVGIENYEAAREQGAILATGHEHSYARTHLMSSFEDFVVQDRNNTLNIEPGKTFVFVSGLGGQSIRDWNENLRTQPYWAVTAASDNGVSDGVLLCTFHIENDPRLASCEFVDRLGKQWDSFRIYSKHPGNERKQIAHRPRRPQIKEFAVLSADDDYTVVNENGKLLQGLKMSFGEGFTTFMRFRSLSITVGKLHRVDTVHLQVYGASLGAAPSFIIRASADGGQTLTDAAVVWDYEEDGFENESVWVSPSLLPLFTELAAEYKNLQDVTIVVTGKGFREVWATEQDQCFAPTLSFVNKLRQRNN